MARFETGSYSLFQLGTYEAVYDHYQLVPRYRTGTKLGDMVRGLSPQECESIRPASSVQRRRKHQIMYIRDADKAIVFKMYRTNVLAFTPQNTIEVEVHCSTTTTAYINELLPPGVSVQCTGSPPNYTVHGNTYHVPITYKFTLKRTEQGRWEPLDEQHYDPIEDISIDLPKYYAAIKKYKYKELEDFITAAEALGAPDTKSDWEIRQFRESYEHNQPDVEDYTDALRDGPKGWPALFAEHRNMSLYVARECLLAYELPFHRQLLKCVPSKSYSSVLRRLREYKWMFSDVTQQRAKAGMSQTKLPVETKA